MTLPNEIRWPLAQARAERIYDNSPAAGLLCGPRKLGIADDNIWAADKGVFVFKFGAYGATHVLAYGYLEDALEDAATWLAENAPGHLTEPECPECSHPQCTQVDSDDSASQFKCDKCGHTFEREDAEADLTHTESGWLLSHEWTCTEIHEPSDLLAYVRRN